MAGRSTATAFSVFGRPADVAALSDMTAVQILGVREDGWHSGPASDHNLADRSRSVHSKSSVFEPVSPHVYTQSLFDFAELSTMQVDRKDSWRQLQCVAFPGRGSVGARPIMT